jgi:hypothetical protein
LVSTSESQSIEYTNLRYTAKIGVGFSSGKWSAGVAVLLPSIGLAGSGTIARDIVANNLQVNIEPNPNKPPILVRSNIAANDRQEKLATTYNTPLSISAGFAYKGTDFLVAASAEWFGSVSLYNIMSPQDNLFKRPTTLQLDGKKFLEVNASNKSIINFAIGAERSISDRLSLSTGFRTNRSFYDKAFDQRITDRNGRTINNNPLNLDISSWDVYHVVLGATLKQERRDLSIGITYSWANDGNIRQFANFDQPTENTFLLGQKLTTTASYYSFGVLLGYTLRVRSEN